MKKLILLFFLITLFPVLASAGVEEINGIYYDLYSEESQAAVTGSLYGYDGDIDIPASFIYDGKKYEVTSIANSAFSGCSGLTTISIPNSVKSIGDYAFNGCSSLTSLTIPHSVTSIGDKSFEGCKGLTSVNIPSSVTSIGINPFASCDLTSITVEEGNPVYDSRNDCNAIIETATTKLISGCKNTSIGLWSNLNPKSIGESAFYGCTGLTAVCITISVEDIGDFAFQNCPNLTDVWFSGFPFHIGLGAFLLTPWYDNQLDGVIYVSYGRIAIGYKGTMSENTSIVLNDDTWYIADGAFYNCSGLSSVTIPDGVTSIGQLAFELCKDLKSVEIPNSVSSIGQRAFQGCSKLETVNIPTSLTTIEDATFLGCALTSVTIPDGVTSIENNAFLNCLELQSVTFPKNLSSIGDYAFFDCLSLSSVNIPSSVTSIGEKAFYYCKGLANVHIGSGITSIGANAFADCPRLDDVYCSAKTVPTTSSDAFSGSSVEYVLLHVPEASVEAYKAQEPWKSFKKIIGVKTGDVNGDGMVTISDAVIVVNAILGYPSEFFNEEAADINHDEKVTIADAVAIVNIIKQSGETD